MFLLPLWIDDHTSLSVQELRIKQGRKKAISGTTSLHSVGCMTKDGAKGASAIGRYRSFISRTVSSVVLCVLC
jgi:hypothetical protein